MTPSKKKYVIGSAIVLLASLGLVLLYQSGIVGKSFSQEKNEGPAAQEKDEGRPELLHVTRKWFADKDADPGLKLTEETRKGLGLATAVVKPRKTRPLPPQIGTLNYDNETMFLIKCRFNGELVWLAERDDTVTKAGYEKPIKRPLKFGDKVKQGEVLAEFWSVTLGTAKAAFVDAISAVRLSQTTLDRQLKVAYDGALSVAALNQSKRQLQADNNTLMTAERTLRMWKMTDKEIEDLRKEANEIIDSRLLDPTGKISSIDAGGMTLLLSPEDKVGKHYKFAGACKFYEVNKDDKEVIKGGLKADIFKKIGKDGLSAKVTTDEKGDVTEVVVSKKERNLVDEVNRWARTEVYVPQFDKLRKDRELTVVEKNTNIGDIVDNTNFSTWLFRVADLSRLQIWVHPPEEYLPLIREGLKNGGLTWEIRMQSDPTAPPHILRVDQIAPSLEPNQHNPMVVGYLPNKDHKYLVGQFVTATLYMRPEPDTVEIPTEALNELKGQSFVFVKDEKNDGEYLFRRVAVVRRYADYTVIRSVLRAEDRRFSEEEVKQGRYPLRPLRHNEKVLTRGVVELTTALENLLVKENIKLSQ